MDEDTPVVDVPKPQRSLAASIDIAVEMAFNALINTAQKEGINLSRPMGLMYLETEKLTEDFKEACHNIMTSIITK